MDLQKVSTAIHDLDLEYHKTEPNKIWKIIQPYFESTFGELAEFEYSRVIDETKLKECFVDEFYGDSLEMVENIIDNKIVLTDGHIDRNYTDIKSVNELNISLKQYQEIVLLLGDIGVGKTTLIGKLITDNRKNIFFINISLRNKSSKKKIDETIKTEIKETIINQFEDFLANKEINIAEANKKIFEKDRKNTEQALGNIDKKRLEKQVTKTISNILDNPKLHFRRIVHYLRENKLKACIVLDGADFIDNVDLQRYIYRTAKSLSEDCHCNIILSLRETSIPKANRRIAEFETECVRFHLFPPNAKTVLDKRTLYLKKLIESIDEQDIQSSGVTKIQLLNFIDSLYNSIKQSIKEFEYLANFSIRAVLDLYRCIACSGHLSESDISYLMNGKLITWHKIIKTLVLYAWDYYNSDIHLIVNLYDDNDSNNVAFGQNLIRIRILQMIEHISRKSNNKVYSADIGLIISKMGKIGYARDRVIKSIEKMFNNMLIDSPEKQHRMFNSNVTSLKITMCGYYYLHTLIFTLRYIQGIMHATNCWDSIAIELRKESPDAVNRILHTLLFIGFIKEIELQEQSIIEDEEGEKLIKEISNNSYLTKILLNNVEKEIDALSLKFPDKSVQIIQSKIKILKEKDYE